MANWSSLDANGKVAAIKQAWTRNVTAARLAKALGTTRASISGVYHRHREQLTGHPLGGRSARGAPARRPVAKPAPVARPRPATAPPAAIKRPTHAPTPRNLPLEQLNKRDCRWPITDGSPWLFCGCAAHEESSYCTFHKELSKSDWQKQKERAGAK